MTYPSPKSSINSYIDPCNSLTSENLELARDKDEPIEIELTLKQ
jgi:hypothetical protein